MNILPNIDYEKFLAEQESQFVKPASDFAEEVGARLESGPTNSGDKLPWSKTHHEVALRPSEVTIWAGVGGSGKSLLTGQVFLWLLKARKCLIASLEMPPAATLARMLRQAAGTKNPSKEFQQKFFSYTNDRLWIYDQTDTVAAERILGMCHYAATELGMEHIMIDSLVKCGIPVDDYNAQKSFLDRLQWFAKGTQTHAHVIHHLRKGQDPKHIPNGWDLKGAGELRDLTDNLFLVWRNKQKENLKKNGENYDENEADTLLIIDKQRHGEWEGTYGLYFRPESLQFCATSDNRIMNWDFWDVRGPTNTGTPKGEMELYSELATVPSNVHAGMGERGKLV